jgi:hypothetical protein
MQATSQNNSHNIPICHPQDPTASIVTRNESSIIILMVILLQSITTQLRNNGTIVIKQNIVQLIRLQGSSFNVLLTSTLSSIESNANTLYLYLRPLDSCLSRKAAEL